MLLQTLQARQPPTPPLVSRMSPEKRWHPMPPFYTYVYIYMYMYVYIYNMYIIYIYFKEPGIWNAGMQETLKQCKYWNVKTTTRIPAQTQ
jgi:hypothetical protein